MLAMDNGILVGRLHPMVLHFPLVCILLAMAFEWLALVRRTEAFGPATRGLLVVGALTAIVTVLSGLKFAEETTFVDERAPLFERHKIAGFVATGAAVLAVAAGIVLRRAPSRGKRIVYLVLVHVAGAAVAIGAHAGGLLHWGSDFFG